MQLGDYNSGNTATTNNPSVLAAQDYEDALLERLANVDTKYRAHPVEPRNTLNSCFKPFGEKSN